MATACGGTNPSLARVSVLGGKCMAVDAARARELALTLPSASEAPHFDRAAFRTPRKIFATLGVQGGDLNLMFDPDLRDFYCEHAPQAFTPVPGGWGRRGATRCDLRNVDEATLISALRAAHRLALPKAKGR
jgi:YjbR